MSGYTNISTYMISNNGMSSYYTSSSYAVFLSETAAGRPYTVCLKIIINGHLVLSFRADAVSNDSGNITEGYNSLFVCHDPYGDYNYTFANDNGSQAIITDYKKDSSGNWSVSTRNLTTDGITYFPIGNCARAHPYPGGYSDADVVGDFPSSDLSHLNQNGNATGDVVVNTDNTTYVEMWVCSTNQGMAYYTSVDVPSINLSYVTGIDVPEMCDYRIYLEDGKVKVTGEGIKDVNIITISGIKLNSSNKIPSKGVYVVRVVTDSGNVKVSKLVIKKKNIFVKINIK